MNCFSTWCNCLSSTDQFSGKQIEQDAKLSKVLDSAFSRENSPAREVKWEEEEEDDEEELCIGVEESKECGEPPGEEDESSPVEVLEQPPAPRDREYSPSGYPIDDRGAESSADKEIIVHPLYPKGSAHFLHPNEHLRLSRSVRVPGIPFDFVVSQRQQDDDDDDDTGFSVWRGSVALSAYLVKHAETLSRNTSSIELGCGSGALASSVASWLGLKAQATDRPQLIKAAEESCREHREAAAIAGAPMTGPPVQLHELEWGPETAAAYVEQHGRFDVVLGSEVVYALAQTTEEDAILNFRKLVATIDALLDVGGIALIAWCPRSRLEEYFFSTLPEFRLVANKNTVKIDDLGLSHEQTDGLQLVSISRQVDA